ncbi:MAG: hypothetical protein B6I28_06440 [Fusobacteriia bacterium 4572_132]|nr:MAG: hypothetical protein B6I28_06440 [Fusobacteriia bacterium 4572_132]
MKEVFKGYEDFVKYIYLAHSTEHVFEFSEMKVALIFGQVIYKNNHNIIDDELTINIANFLRDVSEIENKIKINNITVKDNILEVEVVEFPIKPDNTVSTETYYDEEKELWYLNIDERKGE